MRKIVIAAVALGVSISGIGGITLAQETPGGSLATRADGSNLTSTAGDSASLPQGADENLTATDGNATIRGTGNASAGRGSVIRSGGSGVALLGPDGTYRVTDNAPADVTISGDTNVLSPPAAPAESGNAPAASSVPTCASYGSWYDAQIAYENAGRTDADPALVQSLDPDYDGIACEEGMS